MEGWFKEGSITPIAPAPHAKHDIARSTTEKPLIQEAPHIATRQFGQLLSRSAQTD